MDAQEKYEYWLDIAEYDLECAEAMYNTGRWLYVVFMCQQAVEKIVKGLYVLYIDDNVPKTHNIRIILEKFEDLLSEKVPEDNYNFVDNLTVHYLNGRYTDYKQNLSERIDEQTANYFLQQTKEVFSWLLTLKP